MTKQEPILEVVGGESEESDTPEVADPTGAVTFGKNPDNIMDATIDELPVSPTLPYPLPTVHTQRKG